MFSSLSDEVTENACIFSAEKKSLEQQVHR